MRAQDLRAIVLAGGYGRRLRSLVRRLTGTDTAKQFCRLGDSRSLLQATLDRIAPVAPARATLVVVQSTQRRVAKSQVRGFDGIRVIAQPADRGTAPGVLLPLLHHVKEEPGAIVLITPSDHAVGDALCFNAGVQEARQAVEDRVADIVLLGAAPSAPRTDFGWIAPGKPIGFNLFRVREFVEKPPAAEARRLLSSGALWNTLVVVARARQLCALFDRRCPGLVALLAAAVARPALLRHAYAVLRPCDFSRDVLTGADDLAVYEWPASMQWNDLGEPGRLLEWLGGAVAPAEV